MEGSLEATAFSVALYGLGALGFLAVTALPVRLWVLLRRHIWAIRSGGRRRAAYLALALSGAAALACAAERLGHVGRCLLGYHCSANAAGGWVALAGVAFWWLAFELAAFLIVRLALRPPGSQPNNSSKPTPLRGAA